MLTDFGIAKILEGGETAELTGTAWESYARIYGS